jgi:hypothetical protein
MIYKSIGYMSLLTMSVQLAAAAGCGFWGSPSSGGSGVVINLCCSTPSGGCSKLDYTPVAGRCATGSIYQKCDESTSLVRTETYYSGTCQNTSCPRGCNYGSGTSSIVTVINGFTTYLNGSCTYLQ